MVFRKLTSDSRVAPGGGGDVANINASADLPPPPPHSQLSLLRIKILEKVFVFTAVLGGGGADVKVVQTLCSLYFKVKARCEPNC